MDVPAAHDGDVAASFRAGRQLLGLRLVQYGLGFLGGVVIARALGPDGRAAYALPLNLVGMVLVASHLSIELAMARLVGRGEATFHALSRLAITLGSIVGVVGTLLALLLGLGLRTSALGGTSPACVILAAATIAPMILGQFGTALLLRRGAVQAYGAVQAAQALVQLLLLVGFQAGPGLSPSATLSVNLGVVTAATIAMLTLVRRDLGPGSLTPALDRDLIGRALRIGLVFHPSSVALFLNLRLDLLLVGAILSVRRAGIYSLAVTLAELGAVASSTLSLAALRHQTELGEDAAVRFTVAYTRRTMRGAAAFVVVAAVLGWQFIRVAYGSAWTDAALPFALLSIGTAALAIEEPARGLLLRIGRPWTVSAAAVAGLVVNVGVNVALLGPLGLVGAAVASIASYWTAALLMVWLVRRASGMGQPTSHPL